MPQITSARHEIFAGASIGLSHKSQIGGQAAAGLRAEKQIPHVEFRDGQQVLTGGACTKVLARKSIFRLLLAVGTMGLTPVIASDHM